MPDEKNDDLEVPHIPTTARPTIVREFKADKVPVFWGPGQEYTGSYVEPSGWHNEYLKIPIIGRFIHCNESAFDTDKYDESGGGGGDPDDYYVITLISDHQPPFPFDFVIYYNRVGNALPAGPGFFSTTQFVLVGADLVNVGASLSPGMKWQTFGAAFSWIQAGINGPGWYPNSGIPPGIINFF